ncbi:MAG: acyl-CoA/acyl-ACP dehydrogenase [Chloroflexi bacterium]|nr:acyl-CoA/acyl-ACP dehydrogenase [Chloroflexota bacterium]MBV9596969.1 acyl-CoA/acyl-ACP dehydrogenase [Chloroflexota bacterium]
MDFDFTQEQVMLRDLTREFMTRESTPRAVRSFMEDERGFSDATWQQLAEMGLQGLTIDAGYGGQGLGMVELALVLDEMGRAAYPAPFFATVVLGAGAIAASGQANQMARYLPDIAAGRTRATLALIENALSWTPSMVDLRAERRGDGYVLSGVKRFVPFAHVADLIVVVARTSSTGADGTTVFVVPGDAAGLSQKPNVEMDRTNRTSTLTFDNVTVGEDAVLGEVDHGWAIIGPVLERAALAAAAEMLGASRRCMEMSVEYAKVRQQFGQPIGMFQAIKHACSEMLLEVENSHGATYYAAWAMDAGSPDASLAASAAKAYVGDASRKVCGSSIQVHGGIGFTWEYDLHLYFKRAKHFEPLYGDADYHRERALQLVLAREAADESQKAAPALTS